MCMGVSVVVGGELRMSLSKSMCVLGPIDDLHLVLLLAIPAGDVLLQLLLLMVTIIATAAGLRHPESRNRRISMRRAGSSLLQRGHGSRHGRRIGSCSGSAERDCAASVHARWCFVERLIKRAVSCMCERKHETGTKKRTLTLVGAEALTLVDRGDQKPPFSTSSSPGDPTVVQAPPLAKQLGSVRIAAAEEVVVVRLW